MTICPCHLISPLVRTRRTVVPDSYSGEPTCHGAGRTESRGAARRLLKGRDIQQELREQGIIVRGHGGWASLAEEASVSYKDVAEEVEVCDGAGLCKKVARIRPLGVIKG